MLVHEWRCTVNSEQLRAKIDEIHEYRGPHRIFTRTIGYEILSAKTDHRPPTGDHRRRPPRRVQAGDYPASSVAVDGRYLVLTIKYLTYFLQNIRQIRRDVSTFLLTSSQTRHQIYAYIRRLPCI